MSEITLVNGSAPSTPSAGRVAVFADSADKHLKTIDDAGLVVDLTATGAGGQTDTVAGSLGITNTGDNINAVLTPTYGSAASTVCQGRRPPIRCTDADRGGGRRPGGHVPQSIGRRDHDERANLVNDRRHRHRRNAAPYWVNNRRLHAGGRWRLVGCHRNDGDPLGRCR